jgi:hypothetical protein
VAGGEPTSCDAILCPSDWLDPDGRNHPSPFDYTLGGDMRPLPFEGNLVEAIMRYILLCYDDEAAWREKGEAALRAAMEEAVQLTHELHAKGQYLLASPLEESRTAKSVRVRDGQVLVTDGPFAETREVLGGFYLIDAPDLDEAIRIAARHPGAPLGGVEVRPLLELRGLPGSS